MHGAGIMLALMFGPIVLADTNVDADRKFAWCENIGWTNWRDAGDGADGVRVGSNFLAGFIWSENAGWINVGDGTPTGLCDGQPCYANLDAGDFGVNVDEHGVLHGFAWGENIGWINFDMVALSEGQAAFDFCARRFVGLAWGENVGWINLNDENSFVGLGPCGFGDADCDGRVAGDDFSIFAGFLNGPDVAIDCPIFDQDGDGDTDLLDFARLQLGFGG